MIWRDNLAFPDARPGAQRSAKRSAAPGSAALDRMGVAWVAELRFAANGPIGAAHNRDKLFRRFSFARERIPIQQLHARGIIRSLHDL
jgi:hypothetical protein